MRFQSSSSLPLSHQLPRWLEMLPDRNEKSPVKFKGTTREGRWVPLVTGPGCRSVVLYCPHLAICGTAQQGALYAGKKPSKNAKIRNMKTYFNEVINKNKCINQRKKKKLLKDEGSVSLKND